LRALRHGQASPRPWLPDYCAAGHAQSKREIGPVERGPVVLVQVRRWKRRTMRSTPCGVTELAVVQEALA
jgi:hypothetical protein